MRILFDQCTPVGIKRVLREHEVKTAAQPGWSTLLNGELLSVAERAGFQVLVTSDQNLVHQQNLSRLKIAIVALSSGRWSLIEPALDLIAEAVHKAEPGSYTIIDLPR